jgi:hypothetical protein
MESTHRQEIAASVAAQQTLGPGYDQALAEGLVERIGEEIDNRIEQRLAAETDDPMAAHLDHHPGCRHVRRAQRRAERRVERAARPSAILVIGSLAAAVSGSAIALLHNGQVSTPNGYTQSGPGPGAYFITALIWIAVAVINVAYARRQP